MNGYRISLLHCTACWRDVYRKVSVLGLQPVPVRSIGVSRLHGLVYAGVELLLDDVSQTVTQLDTGHHCVDNCPEQHPNDLRVVSGPMVVLHLNRVGGFHRYVVPGRCLSFVR